MAHRGGRLSVDGVNLENTLSAFHSAVELGYRYLETDVHATADGVLLAFHDGCLDRVTNMHGRISDQQWSDIQTARISGVEPIATVEELFDSLPDVRVNIDIKSHNAIEPLIAALESHNAWDRVCVASFQVTTIREFRRRVGRRVPTTVSAVGTAVYAFTRGLRTMVRPIGEAFQVPPTTWKDQLTVVSPGMLKAAHNIGRVVHVWTINERAEMERLIDMGVDGIITDELTTLRDVLIERDLWEGTP